MIKERWEIGDILVTRVCEFEAAVPGGVGTLLPDATPDTLARMHWLRPCFVTEEFHLVMSIHALLVETPDVRMIVDTCVGNDKNRNLPAFNKLNTDFLHDLKVLGWDRGSVSAVLCTHLHVDHVGWNTMLVDDRWVPTFPNAKYYFGREEYDFWLSTIDDENGRDGMSEEQRFALDHVATFNDSVRPIVEAELVSLVDSDSELAPGISLFPTPGHTPGHVSVMLESRGKRAVITGDVFHHPCQIGRPQWASSFDFSPADASGMRESFARRFAESNVLIIGTHFSTPTAGTIRSDGDVFWFQI